MALDNVDNLYVEEEDDLFDEEEMAIEESDFLDEDDNEDWLSDDLEENELDDFDSDPDLDDLNGFELGFDEED